MLETYNAVSSKCELGYWSVKIHTWCWGSMVTVNVLKDDWEGGVVPVQLYTLHPQGRQTLHAAWTLHDVGKFCMSMKTDKHRKPFQLKEHAWTQKVQILIYFLYPSPPSKERGGELSRCASYTWPPIKPDQLFQMRHMCPSTLKHYLQHATFDINFSFDQLFVTKPMIYK